MLFDLRGRGRRRVVQVIYLFLAVIMGGGLVFLGVGGGTSGGGLLDAFSKDNSTGSTTSSYTKQIDAAQKKVHLNPADAAAWAKLASLYFADGGGRGGFDQKKEGLTAFRRADVAWERYLALKPARVAPSVATQMINLYGPSGLSQPDKAVGVMDLLIAQASPATADLYKQYAGLAYTANQIRKGDLAAAKAVALSPPDQRSAVRAGLAAQKPQASATSTGTATPGTTSISTTITSPPTTTSKGGAKSTKTGTTKTTTTGK